MTSILFWVAVGVFIGWNFEQPTYAKLFQTWIVSKWNNFTNKQ